jgi:hypothetical protein
MGTSLLSYLCYVSDYLYLHTIYMYREMHHFRSLLRHRRLNEKLLDAGDESRLNAGWENVGPRGSDEAVAHAPLASAPPSALPAAIDLR